MIQIMEFDNLLEKVRERQFRICVHSDDFMPGSIFVMLPPAASNSAASRGGVAYAEQAIQAGVRLFVGTSEDLPQLSSTDCKDCFLAIVDSPRAALGKLASAYYGTDRKCPRVIGLTGTNGKTTTTYLLEYLFASAGHKAGVLGTVSYRWPGHEEDANLTTPGCLELHKLLGAMATDNVDVAIMEVSSHALEQQRLAGIRVAAALFTNLTQDHLDFHATMDEYYLSKRKLFLSLDDGGYLQHPDTGVSNIDDSYGRQLLESFPSFVGYGFSSQCLDPQRHLFGAIEHQSMSGMRLNMRYGGNSWNIDTPLVGRFNAYNLLSAQAVGLAVGLDISLFPLLSELSGVPGRLQRVRTARPYNVFVDYAHTPDALKNVLQTLRNAGFKRIITVFGCGGNRDATKRPLMGQVVGALSDVAIVTSDNPRFEQPEAIILDILPGVASCAEVHTEIDRRVAIAKALELVREGDAVLIAGRGHEKFQNVQGERVPFDDISVVQELLV